MGKHQRPKTESNNNNKKHQGNKGLWTSADQEVIKWKHALKNAWFFWGKKNLELHSLEGSNSQSSLRSACYVGSYVRHMGCCTFRTHGGGWRKGSRYSRNDSLGRKRKLEIRYYCHLYNKLIISHRQIHLSKEWC